MTGVLLIGMGVRILIRQILIVTIYPAGLVAGEDTRDVEQRIILQIDFFLR